jgi:hypothetical protein
MYVGQKLQADNLNSSRFTYIHARLVKFYRIVGMLRNREEVENEALYFSLKPCDLEPILVKIYNATSSLVRFEVNTVFFYSEKRSRLLQRWRCT